MSLKALLLLLSLLRIPILILGTIDVNLSELEYLAARLKPRECRRLVAALHYDSYELPQNLRKAARKLDPSSPCLRHLLHWNSLAGEGQGKTHEPIERRLRQLGRDDLADWLGKTVFEELGKDLARIVEEPFGPELAATDNASLAIENQLTTMAMTTSESIDRREKEEGLLWLVVDFVVVGLFGALLFMLVVIVGLIVIGRIARCRIERY